MALPGKHTPEFRAEAVQIALRSSKTISETAHELALNLERTRDWVKTPQGAVEVARPPWSSPSTRPPGDSAPDDERRAGTAR